LKPEIKEKWSKLFTYNYKNLKNEF
jgi:hypothetical protein